MDINKFAVIVAESEGGKKQVDIAQIKQVLKIVNRLTNGILYAFVKSLPIAIMLLISRPANADLITTTLLDNVTTVTQFQSGQTNLSLLDSIVLIGNYHGQSILDLQLGFSGNVKPGPDEVTGADYLAGAFFKFNPFLRERIHVPVEWEFLRSLEYGVGYHYSFRTKRDFLSFQVGFAFDLNPKQ